MVLVVYNVADLVIPIQTAAPLVSFGSRLPNEAASDSQPIESSPPYPITTEEALIKLICQAIDPGSWADRGGDGSIQYYPLGMGMVVCQTAENHARVAELLTALRHLQDVEVAVELRLVSMSLEMAEQFTTLAGFTDMHANDARQSVHAALFDDKQMRSWFRVISFDRTTDIMQAPKITLFNGQSAALNVGDEITIPGNPQVIKLGMWASLLPVVLPENGGVRLHMDLTHTVLDVRHPFCTIPRRAAGDNKGPTSCGVPQNALRTFALTKVLTIPDGKTLACCLGTLRGATGEERELFVFVTPRVILNEDEASESH
jgi:hypothetical protein